MSIELKLISFEQLANVLFIISILYGFSSGNQAAQHELEKMQNTPSSCSTSTAKKSAQLAWLSTYIGAIAFAIDAVVAIIRRDSLIRDREAGTTTTTIEPSVIIGLGFIITVIGTVIRLPAIEQRIKESQEVIL